jgi:hypothetical protein
VADLWYEPAAPHDGDRLWRIAWSEHPPLH